MTARLTTALLVTALRRMAEGEGGAATVLQRGDEQAGGLLVVLAERGIGRVRLERRTDWDGRLTWDRVALASESPENRRCHEDLLQRRMAGDPDLWGIELDVADAERFAAQMDALG